MSFLKHLLRSIFTELFINGKMLVGLLISEGLTSYPGISTALTNYLQNQSTDNLWALVAQVLLYIGAGHRVPKLLRGILSRLQKLRDEF